MSIDFGISREHFEKHIQGKRPHLFKSAISNHGVDWHLVNQLIGRHDHASSNFKILKNGLILKYDYLEQYQEVFTTKYRTIKSKLYKLMSEGASLALNKIENCTQTDQIRTQVAYFTGRQTIVSGYVAFGSEPSFGNHWDTHDVFAVQLIGRKRWTIYAPTDSNPLYKNSSVGKEHECSSSPTLDICLEAGDIFYLPRGWWHEVTASGEETFHLAIGTYPPYVTDYLTWLLESISSKSDVFRLPLDEELLGTKQLEQAGSILKEALKARNNQEEFLQWFSAQQRIDSPYAVEYFGNANAVSIPDNSLIRVNATDCRAWRGDQFIANGIRLNLTGLSKDVVRFIGERGAVTLNMILTNFSHAPTQDVRLFLNEMIKQDVLSIHIPTQKKI
ncbi:cupin domain-containing protein [Xanthomonas sp. WHRI 1810A]|uniref:JmjC domain-containing protein n=1 Tax=Xanthomonas sp. WHRI 1810A TaxID=3161565 RepID=UPI0032E92EA5